MGMGPEPLSDLCREISETAPMLIRAAKQAVDGDTSVQLFGFTHPSSA